MILLVSVFIVATMFSVAGGATVRRLAPQVGAVVPPRPDRWHSKSTPTMGGVGIAVAVFATFGLAALGMSALQQSFIGPVEDWLPVLLASVGMFGVGVLDDRLQLSPVAKLVASLAIGAFLVFALAGTRADVGIGTGYTLVATVWFAGICHAVNLLDNMDGLAAGIGVLAALFFASLFWVVYGLPVVALLVALAGAQMGFLYWNRPTARLFMGDSGSLFIGAMLGGASLVPMIGAGVDVVRTGVLVVLVLIVPLFDTAFVLVLRRLAGRSATRGGTDHVSHRLVSLGLSERRAVRVLYGIAATGGTIAVGLSASGQGVLLAVAAVFFVAVTLLGIYLARVPAYNAEDFQALQKSSFATFLKDLAFRWHFGEVLLDLVLITACYYLAYQVRFDGTELEQNLTYFNASLPVVLGLKLASLYASGLYRRSWETFELLDVSVVLRGVWMGSLLSVIAVAFLFRFEGFSRAVFLIDGFLLTAAVVATRASFQTMSTVVSTKSKRSRRVLVYGAGGFGQLLVREMRANAKWRMNPIAFVDDDPVKQHRWIAGVPVRGNLGRLEELMRRHKIDEVLLSSPAINGTTEQSIRELCARMDRPVRRFQMEIR